MGRPTKILSAIMRAVPGQNVDMPEGRGWLVWMHAQNMHPERVPH